MVGNDFKNTLKKISTPWKVSVERARRVAQFQLSEGFIVDPACGSATQLGAYSLVNKLPAIGIEIDENRANFAKDNLSEILSSEMGLLEKSEIICSSGLMIPSKISHSNYGISLLHIDPARPDNMQEHTIQEMKPNPINIIQKWKEYLGESIEELAIIIDLSPRLSEIQIGEISEQINEIFPNINQTWEWTSQGQGRIDRLSVWIGKIASIDSNARFVRILPDIEKESIIVQGNISSFSVDNTEFVGKVMNDSWITILDSALVSSNLSEKWLADLGCDNYQWLSKKGRRPKIIHEDELVIPESQLKLVSASGKIVKIYNSKKLDELIEDATKLKFSKLILRMKVEPKLQPIIQSKIDNELKINSSGREGFICSLSEDILCLCSFK